ncbi:hypothetical protein [Anaeromyxobacter oryzae]|uniref:hypothetical protein n=1 Tax=Anaeromyxobacter oryzae TaxID=2918170 RepID=UPI0020BEC9B4|nr:hypothetical protein [Anaeromyxobacter oryzae]
MSTFDLADLGGSRGALEYVSSLPESRRACCEYVVSWEARRVREPVGARSHSDPRA